MLLITSIFSIPLFSQPVNAQSTTKLCCERTKSGEYCRFADSTQCDNSYATSASSCEETSFCSIGCCSIETSGFCHKNSPKSACETQGGSWSNNPQCNIQECKLGCCVLGNQYQFITESACQKVYKPFPHLTIDFRDNIKTEQECTELSLGQQQGCCVDQNTCSYGTREECISLTGSSSNFNNNKFCSELNACNNICISKNNKGCIQGKEDVYWFDSCGNPEGTAEDCNILGGNVCGQDNNEFKCISTSCTDDQGNSRKSGESWCEFDTFTAKGQTITALDTPGSRHYKRSCINGRIIYEECKDFRAEVCLEKTESGKSSAQCLPLTGDIKEITKLQPGIKFWDSNEKASCKEANKRESWKGDVDTKPWVNQRAVICMDKGDCGADFNWAGNFNSKSYHNSCGREDRGVIIQNHLRKKQIFDSIEGIELLNKDLFTKEGLQEFYRVVRGDTVFRSEQSLTVAAIGIIPVATFYIVIYFSIKSYIEYGKKTRCVARCSVWQPPTGGTQCSKCTEDPHKPCTEYRCKSLGTTCQLINSNTPQVECVNVEPTDVTPPTILPYEEIISEGYTITPYDSGYKINEPIAPYKQVSIGIKTQDEKGNEEPTQCKVSHELGTAYEDMSAHFSLNDLTYRSEHNTTLTIPAIAISQEILSQTNGEFNLYIKCEDKAGNPTLDDYIIQFTVLPEADKNVPLIELTDPINNAKIPVISNKTFVTIYLNEPADCKYSEKDESYDLMPNEFENCAEDSLDVSATSSSGGFLYECSTNATVRHDQNNIFYIRCRDQPQETDPSIKNTHQQSFLYTLIPSDKLEILTKGPKGEVFNNKITLTVETLGGVNNGKSICQYKINPASSFIPFFKTNSDNHEQPQTLTQQGNYTYNIRCEDTIGNFVEDKIQFKVSIDTSPPKIINLLPTASNIEIVLNEPATCKYSNKQFSFETEGTIATQDSKTHSIPTQEEIFLKCQDKSNNELSLTINP